MNGLMYCGSEELVKNIREIALDQIMDIVFDDAGVQPDAAGKLNQIEGVLSYMMTMEDIVESEARDLKKAAEEAGKKADE